MKTLEEISNDAVQLPEPDRLKLANLLLSVSEPFSGSQAEIDDEWAAEINRRAEELRTGAAQGIPLDEVKRRMERILGREG